MSLLRVIGPSEVEANIAVMPALEEATLRPASAIVEDVRKRGLPALLEHAIRLGDIKEGERYLLSPADLEVWLRSAVRRGQRSFHVFYDPGSGYYI